MMAEALCRGDGAFAPFPSESLAAALRHVNFPATACVKNGRLSPSLPARAPEINGGGALAYSACWANDVSGSIRDLSLDTSEINNGIIYMIGAGTARLYLPPL
jgi:hypothetical protein